MKSAELEDIFSEERTRERMNGIVNKGQNHLTQVPTSQPEAQIYVDDGRVVCSGMFSATGNWRGLQKHQRKRGTFINVSRL